MVVLLAYDVCPYQNFQLNFPIGIFPRLGIGTKPVGHNWIQLDTVGLILDLIGLDWTFPQLLDLDGIGTPGPMQSIPVWAIQYKVHQNQTNPSVLNEFGVVRVKSPYQNFQ